MTNDDNTFQSRPEQDESNAMAEYSGEMMSEKNAATAAHGEHLAQSNHQSPSHHDGDHQHGFTEKSENILPFKKVRPNEPLDSIAMLCEPSELPDPSVGKCIVAVDLSKDDKARSALYSRKAAEFYFGCTDRIEGHPPDWYKAGSVAWDYLRYPVSHRLTALVLGLERVDRDMARAVHSAFLSVLMMNIGPNDLNVVARALGTFIHALPVFADIVQKAEWHLPFGDDTAFTWAHFDIGAVSE
jgi:hypothetical protein